MISILANVGNAAFALPMISAYPTDITLQQFLAWDPVNQALAYVPYVGNALGDFGVTRDLTVGRDMIVTRNGAFGGNFGVVGTLNIGGKATLPLITGPTVMDGGSLSLTNAGAALVVPSGGQLTVGANKVVGARDTGWAAGTGTPQKTTFTTGAVTLPQLAGVVMALQTALIAHGLIGA